MKTKAYRTSAMPLFFFKRVLVMFKYYKIKKAIDQI